ncbi:hypothetical protein LEMLEM_LOCUS25925, partial [Lemmus lemmus]
MLVSHSVWRSEDTCSLCVCVCCVNVGVSQCVEVRRHMQFVCV